MKNKQKFSKIFFAFFFQLVFLSFGIFVSDVEAANPTEYVSLNEPYARAPEDVEYYSFTHSQSNYRRHIPYYRVFIPPGTVMLDMGHRATGIIMGLARHKVPPSGSPDSYGDSNYPTLSELETAEQWATFSDNYDFLQIARDGFTPPLSTSRAGWLYAKVASDGQYAFFDNHFSARVDTKTYNQWWDTYIKDQAGWDKYIESVETYIDPTSEDPNPPTTPSGPGCEAKTCQKVSCHNGTNWSPGTKTEGCATGEAQANPASIKPATIKNQPTAEETTYLTWTAKEAKTLKVTCSGSATMVIRGDIELTSDLWMEANQGVYIKPAGAPDGAPAYFNPGQSSTETCTFQPINSSDGFSGTPFSLEIRVLGAVSCGNNIKEEDEECDYNLTQGQISGKPCPQGKTCEKCQCVTLTNSSYICEPDDPACAKSTCQDVSCFDGCNYHQGEKGCVGRR